MRNKRNKFYEPIWFYIECFMLFAILFYTSIAGPGIFSELAKEEGTPPPIPAYVFCLVLGLITVYLFVKLAWPRLDWIIITDTYAEWHCFLRRKRRVYYEECRYIAVETFNKESHGLVVRGDEFAMIYLSLDPYPEELRGKINRLRCTDRIIKFRYSDKLARAILERAPQEKTRLLYSFYNQMQNYDSRMKRQRKQRKKKKRKG